MVALFLQFLMIAGSWQLPSTGCNSSTATNKQTSVLTDFLEWAPANIFTYLILLIHLNRGKAKNFCLGRLSCDTNIFIKTTPHTYIYIYTHTRFFIIYTHTYIYTLFYLISYIYAHTKKKKYYYYFQSKLCLMAIFHKIKFIFSIFIVKFLEKFILNTIIKFHTKVSKKKSFNWTNEIFKNMNNPKLGWIN